MAGVDATGFVPKTVLEIQTAIQDAIHSTISPTLNLSATSLLGEFVGVTANQIGQLWEAAQDIYAGYDIDQASGDRLTALARTTGTIRKGATYSTVLMTITLAAGTYNAGTLVVNVAGDPTARFDNDATIVTAGATLTNVPFTAQTLGPVRANANTLTVNSSAVSGLSNPTNPAEAILGLEQESDYELLLRQKTELARKGFRTTNSIRAKLLSAGIGITECFVFENDTDTTDATGLPGHSFEVVALGGTTPQAIRDAILQVKPEGIRAYGTTTGTATDTEGNSYTIGYTVPTNKVIFLDLTVTILPGTYVGDTLLKQAITDWANSYLRIGYDVLLSKIVAVCMAQAGVVDVAVEIGLSAGPGTSPANFVIGTRERATIVSTNIAIVQNVVTGVP